MTVPRHSELITNLSVADHGLWASDYLQEMRNHFNCKGILTTIPNKGPDCQEQAEGQHRCSLLQYVRDEALQSPTFNHKEQSVEIGCG